MTSSPPPGAKEHLRSLAAGIVGCRAGRALATAAVLALGVASASAMQVEGNYNTRPRSPHTGEDATVEAIQEYAWTRLTHWTGPLPAVLPAHIEHICRFATHVVIGRVEKVRARRVDGGFGWTVETHATIRVERQIEGIAEDVVDVVYPGGRTPEGTESVGSYPTMHRRERYLLLMYRAEDGVTRITGGGLGANRLDPSAMLPSEFILGVTWRELCAPKDATVPVRPAAARELPAVL